MSLHVSESEKILAKIQDLEERVCQLELAAAHRSSDEQIINAIETRRHASCLHQPVKSGYGYTCSLCGLEL